MPPGSVSRRTCNAGSWTYAGGFTYAWFLDAAVTPFATTASSGILPAAYYNHNVKCVATAFNPSGSTTSTSAQVTVAAGAASIGPPRARRSSARCWSGKILTAYKGVWTPAPTTYTYVWKRGTLIVSRAATYKTTSLDKGKYLTLTVSAVRTGYLTGVASACPSRSARSQHERRRAGLRGKPALSSSVRTSSVSQCASLFRRRAITGVRARSRFQRRSAREHRSDCAAIVSGAAV